MSNVKFVKKEEKKNNIINIGIAAVVVVIVLALAVMVSSNKGGKAITGNHITEISYAEYKEKIKSDDYTIVLLASPTCSHCQDYKPFVNGLAGEYGLEVYYINVASKDLKEEEYTELHDSLSVLKEQYNSSNEPVIPTPTTAILRNGKEVSSILGDIGYNGLKDFLTKNEVIK